MAAATPPVPIDDPPTNALMTVPELAAYLQISEKHTYKLVAEKRIPFVRLGSSLRFRRPEIDAWLEARAVKAVR
jgi:excisionase family DNA binding protein